MATTTTAPAMPDAPVPKRPKRIGAPHVTVEVGREQIEEATQRNSSHCMIAEAIKIAVPTAAAVSVDLQTIRWSDPKKRLRSTYLTPRPAQVALIEFDRGILPEPFNVRLQRAAQISRSPLWGYKAREKRKAAQVREEIPEPRPAPQPEPAAMKPRGKAKPKAKSAATFPLLGGKKVQENAKGSKAAPVVVGGHPPPREAGNMGQVRRFGLRAYRE